MKKETLHDIAAKLVAKPKGILAADESLKTCDKRFDSVGVAKTPEMRAAWRELLFTTPDVEQGLSGVILYDETIRQKSSTGVPFAELLQSRGIIAGIKVDKGPVPIPESPNEKITEGLEGLAERLSEYYALGARFTKWRAVIAIGEGLPTKGCLKQNARILTEYARESQKAGLVPIVEPEVLLDGTHTIERCEAVVIETLKTLFAALERGGVDLGGLILKTSMVLPGKDSGKTATAKEVAEATIRALKAAVPKRVAGVVFLSGGQTPIQATENLNEMVKLGGTPWPLTFSYSRALQDATLKAWAGNSAAVKAVQAVFRMRVLAASAASLGTYTPAMEMTQPAGQ